MRLSRLSLPAAASTIAANPSLCIGAEAFAKGVNVLLGPGVDIARHPLGGRNFEYMGEDPYLAGQSAAAAIEGIQSQHVIATVKHLALNDQEADRTTDSSDASERTMQELDLPAFDAAVKAGVGAVMCSYNRSTSVYACQNPYTLRHVLDDQWGFSGFVMWSVGSSARCSASSVGPRPGRGRAGGRDSCHQREQHRDGDHGGRAGDRAAQERGRRPPPDGIPTENRCDRAGG
jgi:beta-glucosidase